MRQFLILLMGLLLAGPAVADTLADVKERGFIRFGHRSDAPPFSYVAPGGKPMGLAVALCRQVAVSMARQLGLPALDVEFVPVTAGSRFSALVKGQTDLHCGPASATLSRRETLDFSILYFVDAAISVVRKGRVESVFDIEDGTIGVSRGTTSERMVTELITRNGLDAEMTTFATHDDGLNALLNRKIDAYFADQAIMRIQIENRGLDSQLEVLPDEFSFEPYALAMRRGEDALRLAVDRALSEIYDSGLIYNLVRDELGDYRLSPLNRSVYQIVGLPG